jgi:restriction system protein
MADITRARSGEIMRAVFGTLLSHPEGQAAKNVIAYVATSLGLTPFEAADYPNRPGVRRFDKILRFSTIAFVKAGWLAKSKGQWSVTPEGKDAYQKYADAEQFMREADARYTAWRKARPTVSPEDTDDQGAVAATILEEAQTILEEAQEGAWSEVKAYLEKMPPYDFQELVAALINAMGYYVTWISPPGADRGIDIVAGSDPLGIRDPRIKVQVKRHVDAKTDANSLRSFMAVLGDHDVGIYVSMAGFTSGAEIEARTQEKRKVTLIDLERLYDLWVEHYGSIDEGKRALLPLTPVHYLDIGE